MNPASFRVETVRMTCSMHGLKQHIRVVRSFCRPNIEVDVRCATCDVRRVTARHDAHGAHNQREHSSAGLRPLEAGMLFGR